MKRWAIALGCVLSLLGCSGDDGDGGSAGNAGSGAGAGGTAGNAGAGEGGTSGGRSGTGGNAGTISGWGGSAGTAGTAGTGGSSGSGQGGSAGTSGTGGASGASGAGGSGSDACGGRLGDTCEAGSYCKYSEAADCGRADATGVCNPLTDVACGEIYMPVCGCDGHTYGNSCEADQAGMSVDHTGECEMPEGGYDCTLDGVACLIALPECLEGQVPSADGACFGPCVPIEECKCGGPDDCPFPDMYTCWMSAGHCGPYTQ